MSRRSRAYRADGLEHLVAGDSVGVFVGEEQRLRHQARQRVEDVPILDAVAGHDAPRVTGVERPGEHAEPVEDDAFGVFEQRVRPVDGGAQGLVAFECRATPAAQEPEPLVEQRRDLGRAHRRHTCSRELDGERDAVESAAHLHDRRRVRLVDDEARARRGSAFGEELHGLRRCCRLAASAAVAGTVSDAEADDVLARC